VSPTAIGVLLMLLATTLTNVGAVVQKQAVDRLPPFDRVPLRASLAAIARSRRWLVGWLTALAGIVLNMVALGHADLSVIQPLNGFGLVVLAIGSRLVLGERLGRSGLAGIVCIGSGVIWIGALAPAGRVFGGPDELIVCYTQVPALAALVGTLLALALVPWAARRGSHQGAVVLAGLAALCSVAGLTCAKGFFGLWQLVGARALLSQPPALLLLVALIAGSTLALALQQLALQKGAAVVVTPVFAGCSVVVPLLYGRLVFDERLSVLAGLPVLIIAAGAVALGVRRDGLPQQ